MTSVLWIRAVGVAIVSDFCEIHYRRGMVSPIFFMISDVPPLDEYTNEAITIACNHIDIIYIIDCALHIVYTYDVVLYIYYASYDIPSIH